MAQWVVVADAFGVHQATVPDSCLVFSMGHCLGIEEKKTCPVGWFYLHDRVTRQVKMPAMFKRCKV